MSKSQAAIFDVPISWIAMISAILAGSSIVPLFFFAEGGGYMSLGYALVPLVGLIIGPYGGFVAGLIGGTLAMFIMPAAVSGGFPYVVLLWATPPLITGLAANGKWKWIIPIYLFDVTLYNVFPYYIPGPPTYSLPPQPFYMIAPYWYYIGIILLLATGFKLPEWVKSSDKFKLSLAIIIFEWISCEPMELAAWSWTAFLFSLPPELVAAISAFAVPWQRVLTLIVEVAIGVPLLEGLRKAGLRKIPGAAWSIE